MGENLQQNKSDQWFLWSMKQIRQSRNNEVLGTVQVSVLSHVDKYYEYKPETVQEYKSLEF